MKSRKPKLDQSHYNQMADRLGIILSNIDTHIIQHPTCKLNKKIASIVEEAANLLSEAYEISASPELQFSEKPMKRAIIVSGYFNPIHKGHIEYFNNAREHGDMLIVIVNNDYQRSLKGSKSFQDQAERTFIVSNIKAVDEVILSIDLDRTVCESIRLAYAKFGKEYQLAFANGGDQNNNSIPEGPVCQELGIEMIDGLGNKIQSSSWLLNKQ